MQPAVFTPKKWHVVLPFKASSGAKSRLHALYGVDGEDWARAFLLDILSEISQVTNVVQITVVTSEPIALATDNRLQVILDDGDGLNAAVTLGAKEFEGSTLVVPGDLATLKAADLRDLLETATNISRGFVRDATGLGTTLLFAHASSQLHPQYGRSSAEDHLSSGATEIEAPLSLRLDIDDAISLVAAHPSLGQQARRLLALAKNFPAHE